jgi:5-methylcytosine-specific restriction protein A
MPAFLEAEQARKRSYDQLRPSVTERGFGQAWRKIRAQVLERDSGLCQAEGCSAPATEVHHVIARNQGGQSELGNLVSVCAAHHRRISASSSPLGRWWRGGSR